MQSLDHFAVSIPLSFCRARRFNFATLRFNFPHSRGGRCFCCRSATHAEQNPLSAEQIEVYKAFLSSYTNGSKSSNLNIANRTVPLDLSDAGNCLEGIKVESNDLAYSIIHEFDSQSILPANATLVDSKKQMAKVKENDPGRTMQQGDSVEHAVESAFASGLLTLSEVAFDKTHRYAGMNFSFGCGGLCGHGGIVILQKS